jgi:calcineurin-like phosphoesterase
MNILYVGDIMGEPGIKTLEQTLPALRRQRSIDGVIAQAENVSEGRGITNAVWISVPVVTGVFTRMKLFRP